MRIIPAGDRLLVETVTFKKSENIHIVELGEDAPDKGIVVAIGDSVDKYEVGQIVLFGRYCGIAAEEDRHLVREGDIIAVLEDADDIIVKKRRDARWDANGKLVTATL